MKVYQQRTINKWKRIGNKLRKIWGEGYEACGYCRRFRSCRDCPFIIGICSCPCEEEKSLHKETMDAVWTAIGKVDTLIKAIEDSIKKEAEDAG